MSLADAPLAREGFYVTHFLTVKRPGEIERFLREGAGRESGEA
jgi:hypothetical protein